MSGCGVSTRPCATEAEAWELWDTWAGLARPPTVATYNALNDPIDRDYPVANGRVSLPDAQHAFGNLTIVEDGGYVSPWPRVYLADAHHASSGLYGGDTVHDVYRLRARWRLVERDHAALKKSLASILGNNDRENRILNGALKTWNDALSGSGFPHFRENDLRGADLSGQVIRGDAGETVHLRGVDISYSECHLLRIESANMFGAKMVGVKGSHMDASHATCHGASLRASSLPWSRFICADLGFVDFTHATLSLSSFDGANCYGANLSSALLRGATFDCATALSDKATHYTDLTDVKWDRDTVFDRTMFNTLLMEQNPRLFERIQAVKRGLTLKDEVVECLEVKPGAFGVHVNVKKLWSIVTEKLPWLRPRPRKRAPGRSR